MDLWNAIEDSSDEALKYDFQKSVDICMRCIALYKFEGLAFSFNGGKDSTVLLHVVRTAVAKFLASVNGSTVSPDEVDEAFRKIHTIYFNAENCFPEIKGFLAETEASFGVQIKYVDGEFKNGLSFLIEEYNVKAILMGQRVNDPGAVNLEHFSPTDPGWPPILRVNPILSWSYATVWRFLRDFKVPYCSLYDLGYTSLGSYLDTEKNPALRQPDGSYLPACELADPTKERAGRRSKSSSKAARKLSSSTSVAVSHPSAGSSTAGVIAVGNEILSGIVPDANSHFLCRELHALGVDVRQIAVIPDDVHVIARVSTSFAAKYDLVFTTGGLGPTRDDVTVEGVALGFGCGVAQNEELANALTKLHGHNCTNYHLKLADVPAGSSLISSPDDPYPIINFRNIFILPGTPQYLQHKFDVIREQLRVQPFYLGKIYVNCDEATLAPWIDQTADACSDVNIGSHAFVDREYSSLITIESKHAETVEHAIKMLLSLILPQYLVNVVADGSHL